MRIVLILLISLLSFLSKAQKEVKTKKIEVTSSNGSVKELYGLRKDRPITSTPSEKQRYQANSKEGKYRMFYKNHIITEGHYEDNFHEGKWNFYDYSGHLYFEGNYVFNQQDGEWNYYLDDKLITTEFYHGGPADSSYGYYDSGNISFKKYRRDLNQELVKTYYENGALYELIEFKKRKIEGNYKSFYANGQLHKEVIFYKGKPFSVLKCFDGIGKPIDYGNLKNGTGTYLLYDIIDTLKLYAEIPLKNSLVHGDPKIYYRNGQLNFQFGFSKDQPSGSSIVIDNEGNSEKINQTVCRAWLENFNFGCASDRSPLFSTEPSFQGGESELKEYLSETVEENPAIREKGTIKVSILIRPNGVVMMPKVQSGLSQTSNKELTKAINQMPRWNPRFQNGVPVFTAHLLTIEL